MSGSRFSYRTFGTATALGIYSTAGAGALIGGVFILGEHALDNMKQYKITSSGHFRHIRSLIFMTFLFPFGIYFLMFLKKGHFELQIALLVGGIAYSVYVFPVLLLHLQYYFCNRKDDFQYDEQSRLITYIHNNKVFKLTLEDIQKITVFKSRTLAENRTPVLTWDGYNYAVIELKNGQLFKLSSLLVYELDKVIKSNTIEVKKTLYAWIR